MSNFKVRLVVTVLLIMALTYIYQYNKEGQQVLKPLLKYTMTQNYDVIKLGKSWIGGRTGLGYKAVSSPALQEPCTYMGITRHFGWCYDSKTHEQYFNPGVILKVGDNVPVYPVLRGKVSKVSSLEGRYEIIIQHGNELISIIRGLSNVSVKPGQQVEEDTLLGKAEGLLYIEIRAKDGPINPERALGGAGTL